MRPDANCRRRRCGPSLASGIVGLTCAGLPSSHNTAAPVGGRFDRMHLRRKQRRRHFSLDVRMVRDHLLDHRKNASGSSFDADADFGDGNAKTSWRSSSLPIRPRRRGPRCRAGHGEPRSEIADRGPQFGSIIQIEGGDDVGGLRGLHAFEDQRRRGFRTAAAKMPPEWNQCSTLEWRSRLRLVEVAPLEQRSCLV